MITEYRKTRNTQMRGLRADQPLATDVIEGTIYYVTDEQVLERSNGTTWDDISSTGGGGGAPSTAEYLVGAAVGGLSAERVVTDTATITWDLTTPGQAKANGTVTASINQLTGDVTAGPGSGSQAATIANDAVTNAKSADMATSRIKGRVTAGTGDPEDLTGTQATTLLDAVTSSLKGLSPATGGGTDNFLRADVSYAAPRFTGAGIASVTSVTDFGSALTDVITKSLTVTVGDTIEYEMFGYIYNNTGGSRTWTLAIVLGSKTLEVAGGTASSTTTITPVWIRGRVGVHSTSLSYLTASAILNPSSADGVSGVSVIRSSWSNTVSDLSGTQTAKIQVRSGTAGAGAVLSVAGAVIQRQKET